MKPLDFFDRLSKIYAENPDLQPQWDALYAESDRLWNQVRYAELQLEQHNEKINRWEENLLDKYEDK